MCYNGTESGMQCVVWMIPLLAVIDSLAELNSQLVRRFESEQLFSVTATVVSVSEGVGLGNDDPDRQRTFYVYDGKRFSILTHDGTESLFPGPGDKVRFDGCLKRERWGWYNARVERWLKVGDSPIPEPERIGVADLQDADDRYRFVRMEGVLADVVPDDIDARHVWLKLRGKEGVFFASVGRRIVESKGFPKIGDRIELTGKSNASPSAGRRHFQSARLDVNESYPVRVLEKAPDDPFAVPGIEGLDYVAAAALERLSLRKAEGRVVALLSSGRLLMRTVEGRIIGAEMKDEKIPAVGDVITVSGFPSTDMFILYLVSARWRPFAATIADESARPVTMRAVIGERLGEGRSCAEHYGRKVILRGRLTEDGAGGGLSVESDGCLVPIVMNPSAAAAFAGLGGSEVEACGICVFAADAWSAHNPIPRVHGVELFVANPADVRILVRPAYWTARRTGVALLVLSAVFLLAFSAVFLRAKVVKSRARRKALERTRLAAEIHDSLSQNLSGVAGQVAAVRRALKVKPTAAGTYLECAERMLTSSRTELQRCLFDLRGNALEEPNLGAAIRKTLAPMMGTVRLNLRFKVPRQAVSESVAHAVLCIVRELVSNGIVHGQAKSIRIAGTLEAAVGRIGQHGKKGACLLFSVTDDGDGFDPENAAGIAQGHFGLQGIRERLNRFGGSLVFSPVAPHGCSARVTIPL